MFRSRTSRETRGCCGGGSRLSAPPPGEAQGDANMRVNSLLHRAAEPTRLVAAVRTDKLVGRRAAVRRSAGFGKRGPRAHP